MCLHIRPGAAQEDADSETAGHQQCWSWLQLHMTLCSFHLGMQELTLSAHMLQLGSYVAHVLQIGASFVHIVVSHHDLGCFFV